MTPPDRSRRADARPLDAVLPDAADVTPERARVWALLDATDATPAVSPEAHEAAWARIAARAGLDAAEAAPGAGDGPGGAVAGAPASRPALRLVRDGELADERATPPDAGAAIGASRPRAWPVRRLLAAAAALAVLATGAAVARDAEVVVPAGGQRVVTLPDGTRATLNAGSRLRWPRGFRRLGLLAADERRVTLDGEGFFDVRRDGRPFRVATADAVVTVLGTRFDVRAYAADAAGTTVVVEEGRVRVAARDVDGAVELTAGESAAVRAPTSVPTAETADPARASAWRRGGFAMEQQSLTAIARELARRYDVRLEVDARIEASGRLSLFYPAAVPLETILADLATARGLRFRAVRDGYALELAEGATDSAR